MSERGKTTWALATPVSKQDEGSEEHVAEDLWDNQDRPTSKAKVSIVRRDKYQEQITKTYAKSQLRRQIEAKKYEEMFFVTGVDFSGERPRLPIAKVEVAHIIPYFLTTNLVSCLLCL